VYTGGDVCAVSLGRRSLIGVLVMSVVVFFRPLAFQFPVDGVGGGVRVAVPVHFTLSFILII
jgi:hypothetical protein